MRPQRVIPPARVAIFVAAVAGLLMVVLFPLLPSALDVEDGQIAAQTIRAPRDFTFNSETLRAQIQEQRVNAVAPVTYYDPKVKGQQLSRLTEIVNRITTQRDTPGLARPTRLEGIARIQGTSLTLPQRNTILDYTPDQWTRVVDESFTVLGRVLEELYPENDVESHRVAVRNRINASLSSNESEIVAALVQPLVVATQQRDDGETRKAQEKARAGVEPQRQTFVKGQVIVRDGDVIDGLKREALKEAGLLDARVQMEDLGAVFLVALLAAGALGMYLQVFQPPSLNSTRRLLAVACLVGGLVLVSKIYLPLVVPDTKRYFLAYCLPVAAAPMLVAVLFEAPFALAIALVVSILASFSALYMPDVSGVIGLHEIQPLQLTASYLFGSLAGVLVMHRAERLNRFLLAGLAVAGASMLATLAFWFLDASRAPIDLAWIAGTSLIAGVLSAVLTVGLFALLGSVFGITTRLQLMELAQFNAPLLRRLQEEAPGTFHHSILVGNLAERAADLIGADSLLARIGAYYHDIGKIGRPGFFAENQLAGDNPHDGLDPVDSSQILQEHVRHGLDLARRHRLPERVRACIGEHHGTLRTLYFYRMAAKHNPDIDPALFAYPGPRPQSRETALVMLADSTEASVRAAKDHAPEKIDAIIENVIAERLAEGQFDDCELTLRDLRTIAESFKYSMRAIYHQRVEYPEPTAAEIERRRAAALPSVPHDVRVPLLSVAPDTAPLDHVHGALAAPATGSAPAPDPAVPLDATNGTSSQPVEQAATSAAEPEEVLTFGGPGQR